MHITNVKVKLAPRPEDKLLAFATITFDDCFVVRDIKVIQGASGIFVAMPSRKMTDRCVSCGAKNPFQARYCGHCGKRLSENRVGTDNRGRAKFHADIAHPINSRCRLELQEAVLREYQGELARSRQPGYVPASLDDVEEGPPVGRDGAAPPPASHQTGASAGPSPAPDGSTAKGPAGKPDHRFGILW